LVHKGYLGTPGRTRTSSLRIRSPSRHNPLTRGYTREPSRSKGFECSTVCTTLHWFSMKRVLSASWDTHTASTSATVPTSRNANFSDRRSRYSLIANTSDGEATRGQSASLAIGDHITSFHSRCGPEIHPERRGGDHQEESNLPEGPQTTRPWTWPPAITSSAHPGVRSMTQTCSCVYLRRR
jgi:hypothetical protein